MLPDLTFAFSPRGGRPGNGSRFAGGDDMLVVVSELQPRAWGTTGAGLEDQPAERRGAGLGGADAEGAELLQERAG